jgi:hypothetical protein
MALSAFNIILSAFLLSLIQFDCGVSKDKMMTKGSEDAIEK